MAVAPAIQAGPPPTGDYVDWDRLFDKLHSLGLCGCKDCGPPYLQGGRCTDGGFWLAWTAPSGERDEFIARSPGMAAWKLMRSLPGLRPLG